MWLFVVCCSLFHNFIFFFLVQLHTALHNSLLLFGIHTVLCPGHVLCNKNMMPSYLQTMCVNETLFLVDFGSIFPKCDSTIHENMQLESKLVYAPLKILYSLRMSSIFKSTLNNKVTSGQMSTPLKQVLCKWFRQHEAGIAKKKGKKRVYVCEL